MEGGRVATRGSAVLRYGVGRERARRGSVGVRESRSVGERCADLLGTVQLL